MAWLIERRQRVAVVTMNTNKVNAQGHAFFSDLHEAFDRLERDHPDAPVVLTGTGTCFSAGLDLEEHTRLFAGSPDSVNRWLNDYRTTNLRLFTYPRPTVAAVNGHAIAGGLLTAALCDYRVCAEGSASFAMKELQVGVPVPAVYVRILAYAFGEAIAARLCLFGETFDPAAALRLGLVHTTVHPDQLLNSAATLAATTPEDCLELYRFTKKASQATALRDLGDLSQHLDNDLAPLIISAGAGAARERYWRAHQG